MALKTSRMWRGDIVWADLDPVREYEAAKRRPAVVVSGDESNSTVERLGRGLVTVVPLTSRVDRGVDVHVLLPMQSTGLRVPSAAQVEQIRAISINRLGATIGQVPPDLMADIDEAIRLHLDL